MSKDQLRERQREYWRRRTAEMQKAVDLEADAVIENMRKAYDDAARHIDGQIAEWYQKFADNNEVTYQEARKRLDAGELEDFRMSLDEYIRHGEELDIDPSWEKTMINASSKHHINRLEALKMTTQAELEEAAAKISGTWMERTAKTAYLRALFAVQMAIGVAFNAPNTERVVRAAKKPWTPDGMEFTERKGVNNAKLVQKIQRELTQGAITGEKWEYVAERVSKAIGITKYEAERIIRTESTHLETEASMQAYKGCGIDRYQILVTLDKRTCETCAQMDLTVWKVSERADGFNAPPFHPNCRCTTIAYFDDPELAGTRAARNAAGKTVFIDDSMSYSDWLEEYGGDATDEEEQMASSSYIHWPQVGTKLSLAEFKELRTYAEQRGLTIIGVRGSDLNSEAVKSAIDGVHSMSETYRVQEAFKKPITLNFSKSLNPNNFAAIRPNEPNVIYFNKDAYRDIKALEAEYAKKADQGWFVKGTDYRAIPYHEMGHMIEGVFGIDSVDIAKDILGTTTQADTLEKLMEDLSQYAGKPTGDEIMSECFAAAFGGAKNEFALKFVDRCNIIISRR